MYVTGHIRFKLWELDSPVFGIQPEKVGNMHSWTVWSPKTKNCCEFLLKGHFILTDEAQCLWVEPRCFQAGMDKTNPERGPCVFFRLEAATVGRWGKFSCLQSATTTLDGNKSNILALQITKKTNKPCNGSLSYFKLNLVMALATQSFLMVFRLSKSD